MYKELYRYSINLTFLGDNLLLQVELQTYLMQLSKDPSGQSFLVKYS